jgi:phage anti-repressor protein
MLNINEKGMIYGEEIHRAIESKLKRFDLWLKQAMENADLQEGKDFCRILHKSTGGRPRTQYEFTIDAAKEICLLERNEKGKQIRRWLIEIGNKRENLEYLNAKEIAFSYNVINALKYIDNQKQAYTYHRDSYVKKEGDSQWVYADFARYRANIVGWDKESVNNALNKYLDNHSGHNRTRLKSKSMTEKLCVIDINEAIRVAVLDILYGNGSNEDMAHKFANIIKEISREMNIEPLRKNETNLFQAQEQVCLSEIKMKKLG